jgi:hypothetical protein
MEIETRREILEAARVLANRPLNDFDKEALFKHYLRGNYPTGEYEKKEKADVDWFVAQDRKELIWGWAGAGFFVTLLLKYFF